MAKKDQATNKKFIERLRGSFNAAASGQNTFSQYLFGKWPMPETQRIGQKQLNEHTIIVGGGFSGCKAAIELLRNARPGSFITIVESHPRQFTGGIAFGKECAEEIHETNIPSSRLSMFSDRPNDFVNWLAQTMGAETAKANRHRTVPRHWVQHYIEDRMQQAIRQYGDPKNITVNRVDGTVVDIKETEDDVVVILEGHNCEITGSQVVLATGHLDFKKLPCITPDKENDPVFASMFMDNQWNSDEQAELAAQNPDARILIIGTALSGYDAARTLRHQGHRGQIIMMSRSGNTHFSYDDENTAQIPDLPRPKWLDAHSPQDMLYQALKEFRKLTGIAVDPKTGSASQDKWGKLKIWQKRYTTEQVLGSWEKYLPEVLQRIGPDQIARLFAKYSSLINTMRVGASFKASQEIKEMVKSGQLKIVAGHIHNISVCDNGSALNVRFTPKGKDKAHTEKFGYVISSLGPDQDYHRTKSPLWVNLIHNRGYTKPHFSRIGITVDENGKLPNAKRIFAVGTVVAGDRIFRERIIGPVAFSIPGMRASIEKTTRNMSRYRFLL